MFNEQLIEKTATGLSCHKNQVRNVIKLSLEEKCTVPFIARYRKEQTGNLNEVSVSDILESFDSVKKMENRREYVLKKLKEQGNLTEKLKKKLASAETLQRIEDIFLPFKPRRKTRADKAVEKGLRPLAEKAVKEAFSFKDIHSAAEYYCEKNDISMEEAVSGSCDIISQQMADDLSVRDMIRRMLRSGVINSVMKRGKKKEDFPIYSDYSDYREIVSGIKAHRIMSMFRGEKEGVLNVSIFPRDGKSPHGERIITMMNLPSTDFILKAADEAWSRLLVKTIGNEIKKELKLEAEKESVKYFRKNLEDILMAAPFGEKPVIGIDPGIRTGCKVSLIDKNGDYLDNMTLFVHRNRKELDRLTPWIKKYNIAGIAVGDGTFGRETRDAVNEFIENKKIKHVKVSLVNEDGASVYSASQTARDEFPELDITVRGAVSIGRRFQDPLAELVKITPRSLGVGQYQHDINEELLNRKLNETVEWIVNRVGVNLNTASLHLLSRVSGLDRGKAEKIILHRKKHKRFSSLQSLKDVPGIGEKSFEQAAGFLRIADGENFLDATGVHPESYCHVKKISRHFGVTPEKLIENPENFDFSDIPRQEEIPEFKSLVSELKKGFSDPRSKFEDRKYSEKIKTIKDIKEGFVLTGYVENITAFGAFVDMGIKESGLVHISEMADRFVENVSDIVSIGDKIKVKVISVDIKRKRISLSMKSL